MNPLRWARARFQRWWQSRLRPCDCQRLTQRNVYIVPTAPGLLLGTTLLVLLVASINFQLNLGYALTFLLAGCSLVGMHLGHATLRGLDLQLLAPQLGAAPLALSDEDLAYLRQYDWPGNVRELRNFVERSLILGKLNVTALYQAPEPVERTEPARGITTQPPATTDLQTLEKQHILSVLASVDGDKGRAAALLGISRRTLERRVAEWAAA